MPVGEQIQEEKESKTDSSFTFKANNADFTSANMENIELLSTEMNGANLDYTIVINQLAENSK